MSGAHHGTMSDQPTDSMGRATFHHIEPRADVRPTEREIRWLKHIERHGPQSSQYLYELTRNTHRCKDTTLRALKKLRAGGYLRLPNQQRATERSEFNPYIYDLTKQAKDYLADLGLAESTVRPSGHWWHAYTVSCVTSAIDIAARPKGVRFIPAHEILAIKGAQLAVPIGQSKLIPDQLFALDYGGSYRAFALEVDRGTVPNTSSSARKSLSKSIGLYEHLIEHRMYKDHYGLRANLAVLYWFTDRGKEQSFRALIGEHGQIACQTILTNTCDKPGFNEVSDRVAGDWTRCLGGEVRILK